MKRESISQQQIKSQQSSQGTRYPQIQIHPSINIHQLSSHEHSLNNHYLTLILYNYLETPKMEQFLGINIQTEGQLCLVRKRIMRNNKSDKNNNINQQQQNIYVQTSMKMSLSQQIQKSPLLPNSQTVNNSLQNSNNQQQYEYYLLYMVNDNIPLQQQPDITQQLHNRRMSNNSNNNSYTTISLKHIITILISMCDKVIVYQLDKQKQSYIEKVFVQSVNTCQKIKWQTKIHINRPNRLVFVRQCYGEKKQNKHQSKVYTKISENKQKQTGKQKQQHDKDKQTTKTSTLTAATSLQTLQYYSSLSDYSAYLDTQKNKYIQLCSIYPQRPDHPYVQEIIKKKQCIKLISLQQILNIYYYAVKFITRQDNRFIRQKSNVGQIFTTNNFGVGMRKDDDFIQKVDGVQQPWKVRYYTQKVYQLQSITNLQNAIEYEIFHPNINPKRSPQFIRKQIKKYLTSPTNPTSLIFTQHSLTHLQYIPPFSRQVSLSSESKQKLLWKLNRLEKYQHQLHQQHKISPQMSQDKILYELKDQEIFNWIAKYKNRWMEISMNHLKTYFNKIANQKDHKAIQQFKQQCYKMTQKLSKIDIKSYDLPRQAMIKQIIREINTFVDYHFEVLETRRLAGIKFLYNEIKYTLKHKEKVRNKLMLFAFMIILALMQKNVIAGITIATMAIIVLAIRI